MLNTRAFVATLMMLAVATACSSDSEKPTDAMVNPDAGGMDSAVDGSNDGAILPDADTDDADVSALPRCALALHRQDCVPSQYYEIGKLLDATTFGSDAVFRAIDGDYVLIHRLNGNDLLVNAPLDWNGNVNTEESFELTEGMKAIDVRSVSDGAYVLGCDVKGCRMLWRSYLGATLDVIAESELPLNFNPRGIGSDSDTARLPCVYGNGLLCFDGAEWKTEIADQPVVGFARGLPEIALMADGAVWTRANADTSWSPVPDLHITSPRWVDDSAQGGGLLVDPRTWASIDGDGNVMQCDLGEPFAALRLGSYGEMFGVSAGDVAIFFRPSGVRAYCVANPVTFGALIDLATTGCGILVNQRYLTEQALWGTASCAID